MGADHSHRTAELADHRSRLAAVLTITVIVLAVEVVGAIISGSLAVLADAGHMLTDAAGLTLAVIAMRWSDASTSLTEETSFRACRSNQAGMSSSPPHGSTSSTHRSVSPASPRNRRDGSRGIRWLDDEGEDHARARECRRRRSARGVTALQVSGSG